MRALRRMPSTAPGRAQRGAAILMAMLTVVLVATLAASMMWQQWRGVELESVQRTRVQSAWILTGALDWARLILREDAREGGADHLAEPWAVPLAPARLSTFLAAERGQALVSDDTDVDTEAFLAGNIEDLQARLNVTNLIDNGKLNETSRAAWAKLFKHLNLPESELDLMTQRLLLAATALTPGKPDPKVTLWPRSVADLAWLGLSEDTLRTLSPFVTLLPVPTPVNLNTAPVEVLLASVEGLALAQARQIAQSRATTPIANLMDVLLLVSSPGVKFDAALHGVASRFFSVTGQLRMGQSTLQERSVLQRDGLEVKILSRQREVVGAEVPPLQ